MPSIATCSSFCRPVMQRQARRYPVVYALHGYSIGAEQWRHEIHVPQTIEGAFAQGAKEMIVVLPDSKTLHNGSMYSSSVTTGDFENFIAHDLVAYIDAHYRTIPESTESRTGWPLDGRLRCDPHWHEACRCVRSLYIMSPCCLSPRPAIRANPEVEKALEAVKTPEDSAKLSFFPRAQLATAAAWSPNPKNPPLYLDLPIKRRRASAGCACEMDGECAARVHRSVHRKPAPDITAIAIDVGDQDGLRVDTGKLHDVLDKYGIANSFEIYSGTHTSTVADRFQNHVMPFFSKNLCFQAGCR